MAPGFPMAFTPAHPLGSSHAKFGPSTDKANAEKGPREVSEGRFWITTWPGAGSLASSFTGALAYMAPERISGDEYSYASEV